MPARAISRLIECMVLLALGGIALPVAGQTFSDGDLDLAEGGALYRRSCLTCHGPDGDFIAGTDLGSPEFLEGRSDTDLIGVIVQGVPGTAMEAADLTAFQTATIVAYLRSIAAEDPLSPGDASRGRMLFENEGGCLRCHTAGVEGSTVGPDLSGIGSLRRASELYESLLDPNAEVRIENRFVRATRSNGESVEGRILNQDSFTVQILTTEERLVSAERSDLDAFDFIDSPMPSYRDRFSRQELADVVRYLVSLKGPVLR